MTIRSAARSSTGCYTCKRRKKKCDEQKPHCLRCTSGGYECGGYPTFENRIRQVTFGPAVNISTSIIAPVFPPKSEFELATLSNSSDGTSSGLSEGYQARIRDFQPDSQTPVVQSVVSQESSSKPTSNSYPDNDQFVVTDMFESHCRVLSLYQDQPFLESSFGLSSKSLRGSSGSITDSDSSIASTSRQAGLPNSLFSLVRSDNHSAKIIETEPNSQPIGLPDGPSWPTILWHEDDDSIVNGGNDDPEGIRAIVCRSPTLDPNTRSNALPFVLQAYTHWVKFVAFEPLKVAGIIREGVIMQFASSPEVRTRICLIANVIGRLSKSPELGHREMSIVGMLRTQAHQHIEDFHSEGPAIERARDMQNAHGALDSMMEMVLIQRYSSPLSNIVALMKAAAPVFRRACPEPSDQLVNLPNILTSPGLNLQHFAATDVLISVATARPMLFKYDVKCTPETYGQLLKGDYGLRWLHGAPDHFIVLLAWINALYEEYGTNVDPMYIAEIENQVRSTDTKLGFVSDAILLVLRVALQECWRHAVLIYLYTVLCGAQADDPRVTRAVRSFAHVVDGLKPGRNPDSFLMIPIMTAGCFAHREHDRNILRQRIMGLRESSNHGTANHESLRVLEDVWARTRAEDRPAVWSDLRLAQSKIASFMVGELPGTQALCATRACNWAFAITEVLQTAVVRGGDGDGDDHDVV
ncbi:hypothetical protein RHS04_01009 [Rhizoctonia solani]|uniref:Zn(2)-C6 fungal-type domain-containing protein n=1 Tax=Rhizoctonia solani TaxID=456999 RepID=A0A8H7HG68_9AGAM|nr:hypothetical protein RHS04_01009 [Rhizoctonia solani]